MLMISRYILIGVVAVFFISCKSVPDKDHDGVPDHLDLCESTPDEAVDGTGCPCVISSDSLAFGQVQFFIDNSTSMKRLAGETTTLRITLSTILRNTRYALEQKKIAGEGYYLVSDKSQKINYDLFYTNLKVGHLMKARSSPLLKMIESVMRNHDKSGISVLVSDCELVDQKGDVEDLTFKNESIKRFAKDGSLLIYRLKGVGAGAYFYMMVFGRPDQIGWFDTKVVSDKTLERADFGLAFGALDFQVLNYTGRKGDWFLGSYCRTIEQIEYGDSNRITVGLGVNLSSLPANLQSVPFLNKNLSLRDGKTTNVAFEVFALSEMEMDRDDRDRLDKNTTHIIFMTIKKEIQTNHLNFGISRQLPTWIKALSNTSSRNLLMGIHEAYADADNNYFTMKLTLN